MAGVTLKNVSKIYKNDVKAVEDFTLEVKDHEFMVFVGPSGCGKSTVLQLVAGLEDVTQGEIWIGDTMVNEVEPKDRDIAMVFQNYALYPYMTVYDNIGFGLKMRKMKKSEIKERVERVAEILDLTDVLKRKPGELSGGQRQRVAMGRAMVREPKVFLMDEPLSNLDAKLRYTLRREISKLHKSLNATFIYVTHDQTEAMTLGDRIVIMNKNGKIQQVDTPQKVHDEPANMFVASFIGTPQMNFLNGRCVKQGDQIKLDINGALLELPISKAQRIVENGFVDKDVIVGIRSEDIYDTEAMAEKFPNDIIETEVKNYEMTGSDAYLYFSAGGKEISVRVDVHTQSRIGDIVKFVLNPNRIHIFDPETEKTVTN